MNEQDEKKLAEVLRQTFPPMDRELRRDLWPQMLRRCEHDSTPQTWFSVLFLGSALSSVPWFDWALLAALVVGTCILPKAIPIWLYHF
jgi:hypothetical protein